MPTLEHGAVLRAKPSSPSPRRILDATGKTGDREDCLDHASAPAAPSSRSASAAFNVVDIQLGHIEHGAAETELLENVKPHEANGRPNALCPPIPEHLREASQDGSAFFQLSKDASMRFTGYEHRKTVGTLEEVARMSRAARVELAMFSSTPLPEEMTYMETLMFGMLIFNFRKPLDVLMSCIPVLDRHLSKRRAFTRSIIKAGGLERIQLLISIARFDTDGDNQVSEMEFMKSAFAGTICITNAVAVVQGFSLISGLIFVSTHLASIGRPRGWRPEPGAVESFGEDETTIVMWVVYSLNLFAETLALSVMINSVFMRQLLNNALPSVMSKLIFLADTNIVSYISTTTTWVLFAAVWVVALGGFLAVPTHGLFTCVMPLTLILIVVPPIYPAFYTTAVRLYFEANSTLCLGDGAVDAREVGKGADLDMEEENDEGAEDGGGMD